MSGKKLIIGFFTSAQIAAAKDAGHHIIEDVKTASLAAEGAIIASPIGSKVADAINAIKDQNLTGAQKLEHVVADAVPLIESLVHDGGVSLVASAIDTARAVVQTVFNSTLGAVAKGAAAVAGAQAS